MTDAHIKQNTSDEHVFIVVECEGRPTISIDIINYHGRRCLGIRVDGNGILDILLDVKDLEPRGESMFRFCGMCGEKIQMHSSRSHRCKDRTV